MARTALFILPSISRRKAGYETSDQETFTSLHETRPTTARSRGFAGPAGETMLDFVTAARVQNRTPLPHVVHKSRTKLVYMRRAIAQAVSRWLPIAAAPVQTRV
jgi:hypothetical protein